MKIFKFKFTKTTTVFIYIGLALSVIAFGLNTFFLITSGVKEAVNIIYPIIRYTLMYLVSVILFIILLSLLISSYYSVDDKTFKTSFGIIKTAHKIEDITAIVLDRETNKLSVTFSNDTFIVIAVKEEWYDDFTNALLKANRKIEYSIKSKEKPDDTPKKK